MSEEVQIHINEASVKAPEEHKEEEKEAYQWDSCCMRKTDSRLLTFIASFFISMILLIFSCYQLTRPDMDCASENIYISLITLIIGVWVKSPLS